MAYKNFYDRLNKLITKLDEYFTPSYEKDIESFQKSNQNVNKPVSETKTIHIHHHSSQLFQPYVPYFYRPSYIMPMAMPSTTIINNYPNADLSDSVRTKNKNEKDEKDEKDKKDETTQSTLGGLGIIAIVAPIGTYLVATDEYTNYVNSEIETEINNFVTDIILTISESEIADAGRNIRCCFEDWSRLFKNRTYSSRNAKLTGTLSGLAIGGGLIMGSSMIMTGGSIGIIVSGCFFTWNYFTKKIKSEADAFNDLLRVLCDTQSMIADKYANSTYPASEQYAQPMPSTTSYNTSPWVNFNMVSTPSYNTASTPSYDTASSMGYNQPPMGYYSPNTSNIFPTDES